MDIVIISEFCGDFSSTDNVRFLYLGKMLSGENDRNQKHNKDINVEIITSSFHHQAKKHRRQVAAAQPFMTTFIEEPGYSKNISLKRFYSQYVWGKNVAKYLESRKRPDVVYCAVPSLTGPNLAARYCKRNRIRYIIDVQDLWPEAFRMIVNIPILSTIFFLPFKILANRIYKRADEIVAVSSTYADRAMKVNNKCKNPYVIFLGTELSNFDRNAQKNRVLKKKPDELWLAYCGTLGASYDITVVIDALALLGKRAPKFIVMGDGPQMQKFKQYARRKKVKTVFTGRLPYDKMCGLLSSCNITVNPIMHRAAQSIINKHADYMASGLPLVSTQENLEFQKLVDDYEMGFNCSSSNPNDLASKLKILIEDEQMRKQMGANARRCAEEKFDRAVTYQLLKKCILG